MIQTVMGEVDKRELGLTLPHEHILIDMTNCVNITGNEPKIFNEKMGAEKEIQIVTTLRQNALLGYVSKESPLGNAIMGHKVGDRVLVKVSETMSYYVVIKELSKGEDNEELPISGY